MDRSFIYYLSMRLNMTVYGMKVIFSPVVIALIIAHTSYFPHILVLLVYGGKYPFRILTIPPPHEIYTFGHIPPFSPITIIPHKYLPLIRYIYVYV